MDDFHTIVDPLLDVAATISKMSSCLEAGGSEPPVSPHVEGCDRYAQVLREFCGSDKSLESVHSKMMRLNPLSRMPIRVYACSKRFGGLLRGLMRLS